MLRRPDYIKTNLGPRNTGAQSSFATKKLHILSWPGAGSGVLASFQANINYDGPEDCRVVATDKAYTTSDIDYTVKVSSSFCLHQLPVCEKRILETEVFRFTDRGQGSQAPDHLPPPFQRLRHRGKALPFTLTYSAH